MKKHSHHAPNLFAMFHHIRSFETKHRLVLSLGLMIFFFLLCDGIVGYFVPIAMLDTGMSTFKMGLIVGTSSIAGLFFDQILLRVFKQTHFRRLFLFMFLFALTLPFIIWQSVSAILFLLGMAVWGVYYDLYSCGTMDFIGRFTKKKDHVESFGVIAVFIALAYLTAPLIASSLVDLQQNGIPFVIAYVFLGIAFLVFLLLRRGSETDTDALLPEEAPVTHIKKRAHSSCVIFSLLPILLVTAMLSLIESIYWTIAPLIDHVGNATWSFGGIFMFVHQLPMLVTGWMVGGVTKTHAKKRVAFFALLLGSLCFTSFFVLKNPYLLVFGGFLSSLAISFVLPSINGMYADEIVRKPEFETHIETAQDSFGNIGYIIGPMIGGLIAQVFGTLQTFAWVGVIGVILALGLLFFSRGSQRAR
ncbi:MAG: MFS transporter [Candidatus Uhrbacteria bacterium]|nr:MFS transporter [Candidatus Uhrbacteria bacterium]